jgi:hypothetical protein
MGTTVPQIPQDWLLLPKFEIRRPSRKRAAFWLLAQLVVYRQQNPGPAQLCDYMAYVRTTKDRLQATSVAHRLVAKHLTVVDGQP